MLVDAEQTAALSTWVDWAWYSYISWLFLQCVGEKGNGKTTSKPLHFKGTPIHRVVKDFIIQGGDFSAGKYCNLINPILE